MAAAAAASLAAPAAWGQPRPEKSHLVIAVGGKATFYYLPLTIAQQLGYFENEGLDVQITDFAGGAPALQAVLGGAADVASGAYEHTISQQARGQLLQAFVLQGRAPAMALGVSPKSLPHYRTAADLRGKRIGISAPGSSTHMLARMILSRAGVFAGEVNFIGVGTGVGALSAWRGGQLDALSSVDPVLTLLEQKGELRIVADTRTLKGAHETFGGPMPGGCLYAPLEFIRKNPRTVQALANALVHALKWLQTAGPSDIIKTVPESYLLGDRGLYLATFNKVREAISPDGVMLDEAARTALKALAGFDTAVSEHKIDLSRTYTNDFAKRAKERFKA